MRTDIFAFGLVMYEMLAERMPSRDRTPASLLRAILTEEAPALPETVNAG